MLIPGLPLIQAIVATQFLNGLLLPIVLIYTSWVFHVMRGTVTLEQPNVALAPATVGAA